MVRIPASIATAGILLAALAAEGPAYAASSSTIPAINLPPYAFSDELGGFSIATISGIGTRDDPLRIRQSFRTASPVTVVVRATLPINPFGQPGLFSTGIIHVVLDITNDTGIPWVGLELELQEHLSQPSVHGDGLSFDQRRQESVAASSNAFAIAHTDFEPFDRLLYDDGALNPSSHAEFRFLITDLTPASTFYIKLDPRIPAS